MMKLKHILPLLLFAVGTSAAHATFPVRRTIVHTQPDGTTLTIHAVGNGRYTIYSTTDGMAVLPAADGHFYFAQRTNGTLLPSTKLATPLGATSVAKAKAANALLTAEEADKLMDAACPTTPLLRTDGEGIHPKALVTSTADGLGQYGVSAKGAVQSIGSQVLPVVLVNFADKSFLPEDTPEKMDRFFNEEGYHDEPMANGSVRDYFVAQSGGMFSPTFKIVAQVTLANGYAYYGKDGSNGSTDPNTSTFVKEALAEASKTVDFSAYRTEGTTDIPMVALIYAGPGQHSAFEDGNSDYLWAKFQQASYSVNDGASTVRSFFVGNEVLQQYGSGPNDITGASLDGVGLFAHEFGHALGLPDFYNTRGSSQFKTMGYWDIMDYGQYYKDGYLPTAYTAYERSYMGWLKVTELTDSAQFVRLLPVNGSTDESLTGERACVIRNPEHPNEYYLLAYHQPNTWQEKTMGDGMLVLHIDYNQSRWNGNTVNTDEEHQLYAFMPADGVKEGTSTTIDMNATALFRGYRNDLFPLETDTLTRNSLEADDMPLFNGTTGKLNAPIYNIARENGSITFSYLDPKLTSVGNVFENSQATNASTITYDLAGRRVEDLRQAASGIYIVGGKKVFKK